MPNPRSGRFQRFGFIIFSVKNKEVRQPVSWLPQQPRENYYFFSSDLQLLLPLQELFSAAPLQLLLPLQELLVASLPLHELFSCSAPLQLDFPLQELLLCSA